MIDELVKYIMTNRRGKAFCYSETVIRSQVCFCIIQDTLRYALDDIGKLAGVVCCRFDHAKRRLIVDDILTTKPGILAKFVSDFYNKCPGYTIMGTDIHGKMREYPTDKMLRRIKQQSIVKE